MRHDRKQRSIWIVVGKKDKVYAVKVLVSGRNSAVIDLYFPYGHIPITGDGKSMYVSRFQDLPRCCAHLIREAKFEVTNSMECHKLYVKLRPIIMSSC